MSLLPPSIAKGTTRKGQQGVVKGDVITHFTNGEELKGMANELEELNL